VVWGGIIFGFLLSAVDQAIWRGRDKAVVIIVAMAIHEFLFRSFRDLKFIQFYSTFIAIIAYCILMILIPKYTLLRENQS